MNLTSDQKTNLVAAVKEYKKSVHRLDMANKDTNEKLGKLKTCCNGSGNNGQQILAEALMILGQAYLEQENDN